MGRLTANILCTCFLCISVDPYLQRQFTVTVDCYFTSLDYLLRAIKTDIDTDADKRTKKGVRARLQAMADSLTTPEEQAIEQARQYKGIAQAVHSSMSPSTTRIGNDSCTAYQHGGRPLKLTDVASPTALLGLAMLAISLVGHHSWIAVTAILALLGYQLLGSGIPYHSESSPSTSPTVNGMGSTTYSSSTSKVSVLDFTLHQDVEEKIDSDGLEQGFEPQGAVGQSSEVESISDL